MCTVFNFLTGILIGLCHKILFISDERWQSEYQFNRGDYEKMLLLIVKKNKYKLTLNENLFSFFHVFSLKEIMGLFLSAYVAHWGERFSPSINCAKSRKLLKIFDLLLWIPPLGLHQQVLLPAICPSNSFYRDGCHLACEKEDLQISLNIISDKFLVFLYFFLFKLQCVQAVFP